MGGTEEHRRLLCPSPGAVVLQGWVMLGLFLLLAVSHSQGQATWTPLSLFPSHGTEAKGSGSC